MCLLLQSDLLLAANRDCVVLLHGLMRSPSSMETLQNTLSEAGFITANTAYPSNKYRIEVLSVLAVESGVRRCQQQGAASIHFVTHSLGGILLRYYLEHYEIPVLGRVVMLGPPNRGSELVDEFRAYPAFRWINGPAGMQLGTDPDSIPAQLGPVTFELGVIAGRKSLNPYYSYLIPGEDDGKVSVESSRVDGMREHRVMDVSHSFMMNDQQVIQAARHFLQHGSLQ